MQILSAAGNGNGTSLRIERAFNRSLDQFYTCYVWGTFDGATVLLQVSPDGTNWFDTGVSMTVAGVENVEARALFVRGSVSGGGAGVSINMEVL